MRRLLFIAVLIATLPLPIAGQELRLPNKPGSVKFAVIGDTGTGESEAARHRQRARDLAHALSRSTSWS